MAKKASVMQSGGYQIGRLVDQSGGMVDSTVYPTLLNDNEAAGLKCVSLEEKGTVKVAKGRIERFPSAFDAANPCNGITSFYPDTTTSRLVMGAGTKLYKDTPHLIYRWTDQAHFEESGSHRCNADTVGTAGDIKVGAVAASTFARASVKYKKNGASVASGTPSYEAGKFSNGVHMEEATQNLTKNAGFEVDAAAPAGVADGWDSYTDAALTTAFSMDTTNKRPSGSQAQKIAVTASTGAGGAEVSQAIAGLSAGVIYTLTVYFKELAKAGTAYSRIVVYWKDAGGATLGSVASTTILETDANGFGRYVITATSPASTASATINLQARSAASGDTITIVFDDAQFEAKGYATSIIIAADTTTQPSRAADSLYYAPAYALPAEWFVSGFWKPDYANTIDRGNGLALFELRYDANNRLQAFYQPSDDKLYFRKIYGGTTVDLVSVAVTFAAGDIIAFGAAQLTQAYGDLAAGMHFWYKIAGNAVVHISNTDVNLPTAPTKSYAGCIADAGYEANGVIDALKLVDMKAELARRTTIDNVWVEAHLTAAAAPTETEAVLLLSQFDDALTATAIKGLVWISATKDISSAVTTTSGKVGYEITTPGSSTVALNTRTSADGTAWDAWTAISADGTINSTHRKYIQLAAMGTVSGSDKPSVQSETLSYDGTPTASELVTGFTAGGQFFFAALLSKLVITNMLDPPKKWDGTTAVTDLGGTPPKGQYAAAHKNYLFLAQTSANPSRLHFSDVLNIESWPALNFIDISPNDGDWITGLLPFDDYLIITKQRSVWALVGDGTSDFAVKRVHSGIGCVAPRSLTRMGDLFGFAFSEGFYMSDITKPTLITERLRETWAGINKRRLNQIVAEFFDHKLRIDVPNGSSTTNNLRIVYDSIRKALLTESFSDHASCYAKYVEAGLEVLLYGHAADGQVSEADSGTTDAGAAINFEWKTKHFNFGSSATEKKVRNTYLAVVPAASDVSLKVYLIVDNVEVSTALTINVTGSANKEVKTYKIKPRDVGVRKIRTIGYRVVQATTNGGVKVHELLQEYLTKKIKAS